MVTSNNDSRPHPQAESSTRESLSNVSDVLSDEVQAIIDDCTRRRKSGESLSDDDVLAAHPDPKFQTELCQALSHLRMIEWAFASAVRSGIVPAAGECESSPLGRNMPLSSTTIRLRIRCPHCSTPSDRIPDTPWEQIPAESVAMVSGWPARSPMR